MPAPLLTDQDVDEDIASDWNSILDGKTADELLEESDSRAAREGTTADPPDGEQHADGEGDGAQQRQTPPKDPKSGQFRSPSTRVADDGQQQHDGRQQQQDGAPEQLKDLQGKPIDINRAPSTWRPTARALWEKLPEAARAEIYKREGDYLHAQQDLRNDAQFGREIGNIVTPYRALIESEGSTPIATIKDFMQTSAILKSGSQVQKYQALVNVCNRFRIDIRDLASKLGPPRGGQPGAGGQPAGGAPAGEFRDPRVDAILQNEHRREQTRLADEQRGVENQAQAWMDEKDAAGNPLRPYVNDVLEDLTTLIPAIRAANPNLTYVQVMQNAYERATWANPEIRKLLQESERKAAGTTPADNLRRVNGARRAASVNVPRRGSTPAPGKPGTIEETITDTARELGLIQ